MSDVLDVNKAASLLVCLMVLAATHAASSYGQNRASLGGYVKDATSGETLLLANVVLAETTSGTATNNAGYYTLPNLQPGTYTVVCSYVGYQRFEEEVTLAPGEDRRLDIELVPDDVFIDEIVVTAEGDEEEEARNIGVSQLPTRVITQLPTVLEPDVFRSLQLLPGVKAASDFSSGLYIRGGSPDQTLILLDRTTVYNPTHFFGFFSTFNPDAIKDVRLYKGGYPAEYGGRLGAVVDIYNKDGNRREYEGTASVGLLASRAMVEGPHARGSWMVAVRRSTLEPLLAVLKSADVDGIPDGFYFFDVNGKLNVDASPNDRLSLAVYAGRDVLDLPFLDDARANISYGNRTLSANWTHLFSNRLFSNFTFTASRYFNEPRFEISGTRFERTNNVYDLSIKGDLEFVPNERHALEGGFWSGIFTFRLQDRFDGEVNFNPRIQSGYASAYLQETFRPHPLWEIRGGVRANYFDQGTYVRLEPRLSVEYRPINTVRLQAGYGRYYQFFTLITSELFSGFDVWLTTGEGVPPAFGDQFVTGIKTRVGDDFTFDAEVYYRTMRDLFEIDPRLPDPAGLDYDQIFHFGRGYAVGAEFLLEKKEGRLNGFLAYTLGRTRRRFPNINLSGSEQPQFYPPKYDRTHDLNLVVNYGLGRSWQLTSVFKYATGQAYTEPSAQYKFLEYPFDSGNPNVLVSPFNAARLPAYHRLDVGAQKRGRFFGIADYELQLQIINLYSRRNLWFYFFEFEDDQTITRTEVPQIPVPLPNISFTLNF